jgi:hypothetical protein
MLEIKDLAFKFSPFNPLPGESLLEKLMQFRSPGTFSCLKGDNPRKGNGLFYLLLCCKGFQSFLCQ